MPTAAPINTTQASTWFHALSDETRLGIIAKLGGGERCVCELTDDLDAGQSRLSFHLKVLKGAGLVTDRREGRWSYYTLNRDALGEAEEFLGSLRSSSRSLRVRSDCCD